MLSHPRRHAPDTNPQGCTGDVVRMLYVRASRARACPGYYALEKGTRRNWWGTGDDSDSVGFRRDPGKGDDASGSPWSSLGQAERHRDRDFGRAEAEAVDEFIL